MAGPDARASGHDRDLAAAFDGQAERFERSRVHNDPERLERLVRIADLPDDALVLDAGCGPGLVAEALLRAGHRVVGVDLSAAMIARARTRCVPFGDRARFVQGSLFELGDLGPFDAAVSRSVVHHVEDPDAFVARQVELLRPGGVLVVSDHTTDPDPDRARWHQEIERGRDRTHTRNLTPGGLVDLLARAGLEQLRMVEDPFSLDFDEWFDRGTPSRPKAEVRARMLAGPRSPWFLTTPGPGDAVRIDCRRSVVRGLVPTGSIP